MAHNVKRRCLSHCLQQSYIPSQFLDIDVMENLCDTFETVVRKFKLCNKTHLKEVFHEEWNKIFSDAIKKLVELVP